MTGLVAGMGVKAALGGLPWRLIGIVGAGLAVAIFIVLAFHWKHQAADRKEQLASICTATRNASNIPKLDCKQVPQQIQFMGQAITSLSTALDRQSAAVAALGKETVRQQAEAERAVSSASTRARGAEATAERLAASSRSSRPSAVCEPSKTLSEAWR